MLVTSQNRQAGSPTGDSSMCQHALALGQKWRSEGPTDANCSGTHCVTTMPALVPPATLLVHHAEPEICYPQTLSILWGVRGCAWLLKK